MHSVAMSRQPQHSRIRAGDSRLRFRLAVLCAICVSFFFAPAASHAQEKEVDPPGRVARLSLIDGEVSFAPAGTDEWAEAVLNRPITGEDRLWVGVDGRAELQVGSATVHLDRDTQFGFIELDDDVMQMSLVDGAAALRVRRLSDSETIKVETPNATVDIRAVGEYHFEVDPEADQTVVKTRSGEAEVTGGGSQRFLVRANEQGVFSGLESLSGRLSAIAPRNPFEAWANDREQRAQEAESARYVSRDVVGYSDLDDHGEWVHEREYGYVWRPLYVVHDWAPYRFGRWAWVSPWGWTWIDDARWGFAPFHYGRWAYVRHRWCWVPGPRHLRPVYAPALVGWLGGPSISVSISLGHGVGWYPLGPREIFIPGYRHTPRYIHHLNRSHTIIVNNTFITNVYGRNHHDHRYRGRVHAVTAVHRDHFVGGRPIGGHRVHVNESQLRQWRDEARPPAIAPYRESVLAAEPRERRHNVTHASQWATMRDRSQRVDFTAERRAIEQNGGRPVSRAQLHTDPKDRGDFRVARRGVEDVKRQARSNRGHADRSGQASSLQSAPSRNARPLDRDSRPATVVRRSERREIMRADESRPAQGQHRSGSVAPRSAQPERRYESAPGRVHVAPERRDSQPRIRSAEPRARDMDTPRVERSHGNAFRSREASPPAPRQFSAPPEQRSRSHQAAPSRSGERSHQAAPRREAAPSRGGERSHGSSRSDSSSRSHDSRARER